MLNCFRRVDGHDIHFFFWERDKEISQPISLPTAFCNRSGPISQGLVRDGQGSKLSLL